MGTGEAILDIIEHNYIVETVAVISFLFMYEIIIKPFILFLRDKWESRKFRIKGEYIGYYDDQSKSESVKQVSELKIDQRGKKVIGTDVVRDIASNSVRKWSLTGNLLHGHMIAGTYREISHRDSRSVGSFFVVQQENSMDFIGFWTGWDEANNKLSIGEYVFKKKPTGISYRISEVHDRAKIARLSETAFGHNYFSSSIEDKLSMPGAKIFVAREKSRNDRIAAFSLCYMLPKTSLNSFLRIDGLSKGHIDIAYINNRISDDMKEADKNGKIGVIQTICVSDSIRQRGVGRGLFEHTQEYLLRFSPNIILSPAWNIEGKMSASKLLYSLEYIESISIDNYWKSDCDSGKFDCPSRSESKCNCKMSLFSRSL